MRSLKNRFLALGAVFTLVAAGAAYAQIINYNKSANDVPAGIIIPVSNGADSLIQSGTWVMIDTTTAATTNQKRIVVIPWNGVVINRYRAIGCLTSDLKKPGNAATGHRGASGNCLIWGYHPSAKFGSSTQAGNLPIKLGPALYGKATVAGDTTSLGIGWLIGPGVNNAATNPRARVFITRIGQTQSLLAN